MRERSSAKAAELLFCRVLQVYIFILCLLFCLPAGNNRCITRFRKLDMWVSYQQVIHEEPRMLTFNRGFRPSY